MGRKQDQIPLGPRRKRGWVRAAVPGLVLLLAAGGAIPYLLARDLPAPSGEGADAILVLTGGENRIAEGFRAWKEGMGKELFILGAGRNAKLANILSAGTEISPNDLPRIHVEGWSANTLENAFSAKTTVTSQAFRNVILVTSDYHVARAHLALRAVLPPTVSIAVLPVRSDWGKKGAWYRLSRLFLVEGWKYWGYRLLLRWE